MAPPGPVAATGRVGRAISQKGQPDLRRGQAADALVDTSEGDKRYTTEVVVRDLQMLDRRDEGSDDRADPGPPEPPPETRAPKSPTASIKMIYPFNSAQMDPP